MNVEFHWHLEAYGTSEAWLARVHKYPPIAGVKQFFHQKGLYIFENESRLYVRKISTIEDAHTMAGFVFQTLVVDTNGMDKDVLPYLRSLVRS